MLAAYCCPVSTEEKRASFELRKVDVPRIDNLPPGTVLIQSIAVSICGTDLWGRGGCCGVPWRSHIDYLYKMQSFCGGSGHEAIGKVIQVVEPCRLKVGQRVLAMCSMYIRNMKLLFNRFEEQTGVSATCLPLYGAFTEKFVSHECGCVALPDSTLPSFDPLHFVTAQPLGTVIHALKKIGSVVGQNVAVVGQGQNGLIATQLLASFGARRVIAIDLLENRLDCSKKFKATHTILLTAGSSAQQMEIAKTKVEEFTQGAMCDVVLDMVGHQDKTLNMCADLAKDEGTVIIFGLPPAADSHQKFSIRHADFTRNLNYVCSSSPGMDAFELAVKLLEQERFDPGPLFTHRIPFTEFPIAYEKAYNYEDDMIKVLLVFDGND